MFCIREERPASQIKSSRMFTINSSYAKESAQNENVKGKGQKKKKRETLVMNTVSLFELCERNTLRKRKEKNIRE